MQKGRSSRLTDEKIEMLNRVNFVWEAQRGGPRRKRKATVMVPEKATPVEGVGPNTAKRGGHGSVRLDSNPSDERLSATNPPGAGVALLQSTQPQASQNDTSTASSGITSHWSIGGLQQAAQQQGGIHPSMLIQPSFNAAWQSNLSFSGLTPQQPSQWSLAAAAYGMALPNMLAQQQAQQLLQQRIMARPGEVGTTHQINPAALQALQSANGLVGDPARRGIISTVTQGEQAANVLSLIHQASSSNLQNPSYRAAEPATGEDPDEEEEKQSAAGRQRPT
uniref:Uncharacterized protein n=1 Tax=Entomoneis paludosa TaxID=265537 RepID=A0A6U3BNP0_9STRA|mmetsp:Transcript_31547/g.65901  ORF Transcript_31547/g.65901 Transcript_31547/m.65901 type:complete len:279 (+) Transcript_31547:265-1101(+)|eukprot:CAMPEP_0172447318 /NCGR_PEP_ID=MMETSP1065-20121228/6642_1 /TAXON_ID=265537 /ORGANISM="Amphiprora paludosa, Strain CCMP125" /LENGTH=278 /DNA_ID=CAMNT_0013198583 /DNA_START=239 /DNA_END=1075 /DNA_ORIENTATION=-